MVKHKKDNNHNMTERVIEMQFPSTFKELERAVEKLQKYMGSLMTDEGLIYRVVLLASEALSNAMEHGNKWLPEKIATLRLAVNQHSIELEVADEGNGIRLPGHDGDPLAPENILKDRGRGLMFMSEMADEVHIEEGQSGLRLVFYRQGIPDQFGSGLAMPDNG